VGRSGPGPLRVTARLLAAALVLSGCGSDFLWVDTMGKPPELVTTTTTTAPVTTTTTRPKPPPPPPASKAPPVPRVLKPIPPPPPPPARPAPAPVAAAGDSPLTGSGSGGGTTGHPALVVKIDNAPKARPQIGLNEADVVYEEGVEGGITRFAAVFHSVQSDPVGPVRSARSTDINVISPLHRPLFSYSGANAVFKEYVRQAPLVDVGVENYPDRYHRDGKRPAPNNLFSSTQSLEALAAPDAAGPPVLFAYRPAGKRAAGAGAKPVGRAEAAWTRNGRSVTSVSYDWDAGSGTWLRIQDGALHVDAAGRRISPTNVIIQFTKYHDTGLVDSSGTAVPEAEVIGEGDAWVLTGGYVIPARWSKPGQMDVTKFTDSAGSEVRLAPGRTWVELVPPGNARTTDRPADAPAPNEPPENQSTTTTTAPPSGQESSTTTTTTPPPQQQPQPQPQPQPSPTPTLPPPTTPPPSTPSSSTTTTTAPTPSQQPKSPTDGHDGRPGQQHRSRLGVDAPLAALLLLASRRRRFRRSPPRR
jgi:Protein of unknown function (DUF3048) N-terminal domain/Protein of unknown function (DUF3048) C-terminal domain